MSIKVSTFTRLIGRPLNTHNFYIQMSPLSDVTILVSATSFPTEKLGTKVMYYQGEPTYFPTTPQRGGTWSCTLSEGEYAKVFKSASILFKTDFLQDLGMMNHFALLDKFSITVGAKTIDSDVGHSSSKTPFSVKLHGCVFLGMDPVQLNAGSVTQPWSWQLTFQYDSLSYSRADFLSKAIGKLTGGLLGSNYKAGSGGAGALPPLPNLPELSAGGNELLKQKGNVD